jgi:hypothetical protein
VGLDLDLEILVVVVVVVVGHLLATTLHLNHKAARVVVVDIIIIIIIQTHLAYGRSKRERAHASTRNGYMQRAEVMRRR